MDAAAADQPSADRFVGSEHLRRWERARSDMPRAAGIDQRAPAVAMRQRVMRMTVKPIEAEVIAALVAPGGRPRRQPAAWARMRCGLVAAREPSA